jgi:lipoprotein-anchoring transpeptidase ErfK/SrfK
VGTVSPMRLHGSLALAVVVSTGAIGAGPARASAADSCPAVDAAVEPATGVSVAYTVGSTLVGPRVALSQALIDVGGTQAAYVVEYGPSPEYGLCTDPAVLPALPGAQPAAVTLTGLTPATTYHFRVIASGEAGTAAGDDQVFTTLPAGELPQATTIDGIPVGGMKRTAAVTAVKALVAAPARLAVGKRRWTISRAKLGAKIDARPVVAAALAGMPGQSLTAPVAVDHQRLAAYLKSANRRYAKAPRPATVRLVGDHAVVSPAQPGIEIAPDHARWAVAAYVRSGGHALLRLPTRVARAPRTGEKAVVIRLGSQSLSAYRDGKLVLRTPVTTGRLVLPTPVGTFSIQSRYSPYTFISPWPQGSPYYYPPTPVTWAMYFYDNDFLHDDPAEPASAYGPGSQNGPYASHGCVHVPHDAMAFLYDWLPIGAKVIVSQT